MKYNLFVGRFQPLHSGHEKLIRTVLDEGKNVMIGIRETEKDENNPYSTQERIAMFSVCFNKELKDGRMKLAIFPDIEAICYGRDVGYEIREIRLDPETEAISATMIRQNGI